MSIEIVEAQAHHVHRIAAIDASGAVWPTFSRPWWDIASWAWWLLMPGPKKWIQIRQASGRKVRVRAVRLAKSHIRIGSGS